MPKIKSCTQNQCKIAIRDRLNALRHLHVLSYKDISNRLGKIGIQQTPQNLNSKFNQGSISAALFVACLSVMGEDTLNIKSLLDKGRVQKNK